MQHFIAIKSFDEKYANEINQISNLKSTDANVQRKLFRGFRIIQLKIR